MCLKCGGKVIRKSRWRTFMPPWPSPLPPTHTPCIISNPFWRRTSKGTWESQMVPFWSRFPGVVKVTPSLFCLALRPFAQPARFVTWWGGDSEGEGGGGSFIQPWWPRSSIMKQFCSHRRYEVTLFLKAFCSTLIPSPAFLTLQTVRLETFGNQSNCPWARMPWLP